MPLSGSIAKPEYYTKKQGFKSTPFNKLSSMDRQTHKGTYIWWKALPLSINFTRVHLNQFCGFSLTSHLPDTSRCWCWRWWRCWWRGWRGWCTRTHGKLAWRCQCNGLEQPGSSSSWRLGKPCRPDRGRPTSGWTRWPCSSCRGPAWWWCSPPGQICR